MQLVQRNDWWVHGGVWVWVYLCFTSHVTIFQSYMWRHWCAEGLKKKLYLRLGSQRNRHFAEEFDWLILTGCLQYMEVFDWLIQTCCLQYMEDFDWLIQTCCLQYMEDFDWLIQAGCLQYMEDFDWLIQAGCLQYMEAFDWLIQIGRTRPWWWEIWLAPIVCSSWPSPEYPDLYLLTAAERWNALIKKNDEDL